MVQQIRVRYAPSPTGDPHLGNIRTAMFNWLMARHYDGKFIVRIEDTDQKRYVPEALTNILEALTWLGLDWDEGPTEDGASNQGPYAPYIQSQRLELYRNNITVLLSREMAYPCYCTPERLKAIRTEQQSKNLQIGYDRHCRDLGAKQRHELELTDTPKVIRFKVPQEGTTSVTDLIRSEISWQNHLLDDFILLKSDGFPTYHLAVVTDDHLMDISHVLRAEEWLPSTPKHILLYDAFGWEPPHFGHLPMILGPDKAKLSKRHGATSTLEYRDWGYLPDALVNFLALLGWSLDDHTEIFKRLDLISNFSLDRVSKSGAVFNIEKLEWMNGVYIREMPQSELAENLIPILERPEEDGGLPTEIERPIDQSYLLKAVPLIQERIKTLADGPKILSLFFLDNLTYDESWMISKEIALPEAVKILTVITDKLQSHINWTSDSLEIMSRGIAESLLIQTSPLFRLLRIATTGRTASPPLFQTMEVLGKDRCLNRLKQALSSVNLGT